MKMIIDDNRTRPQGTTTIMLECALALREVATLRMPVLIYGASEEHADLLREEFVKVCWRHGVTTVRRRRDRFAIVGKGSVYEFRSYQEQDSPRGKDYVEIFIDHYARWAVEAWDVEKSI